MQTRGWPGLRPAMTAEEAARNPQRELRLLRRDAFAVALAAGFGKLDEDVGHRLGQRLGFGLLAGIGLGAHARAQLSGIDEINLDRGDLGLLGLDAGELL